MAFAALLDGLDAAIIASLTDGEAQLLPDDGSPIGVVHPILELLVEEDPVQGARTARPKPTMRIALSEAPVLRRNDVIVFTSPADVAGQRWQLTDEPLRVDDGRWWLANVTTVRPV